MRCICQMRVRSLKGAYLYMRIGILYDSNRLLFTNVIGGDYNVTKAVSPSFCAAQAGSIILMFLVWLLGISRLWITILIPRSFIFNIERYF